jgi:hypothetical protein|tara:strand:+ start:3568 stop:3993 length:426 start_codon:yes stop_codon:yes gene_type:complete
MLKNYNMEDDIPGQEELQKLFQTILGAKVGVKNNIDKNEEQAFGTLINKLISADKLENQLAEFGGIDAHKLTDPLWLVIETYMNMIYGSEATKVILWYIYDRIGPDGNVVPLEGQNGKQFILKNTDDLWGYIKYKSPSSPK